MIAASYTELRNNLEKNLDEVGKNHQTLLIKRVTGIGSIQISIEEFNSSMETVHLRSSRKDAGCLFKPIQ